MIATISGTLTSKSPTEVVVDCSGVGFHIFISAISSSKLTDIGSTVTLFTHLIHREDAMQLFGFTEVAEKQIFLLLISVSGIGPKSAINILSSISTGDIKYAISNENILLLQKLPGIGRKTAERLIIELKDKIKKIKTDATETVSHDIDIFEDAVGALVNLGYNRKVAEISVQKAIQHLKEIDSNENPSIEEIIRTSFKFTLG